MEPKTAVWDIIVGDPKLSFTTSTYIQYGQGRYRLELLFPKANLCNPLKARITLFSIVYGHNIYGCFLYFKHNKTAKKDVKTELVGSFSLANPSYKVSIPILAENINEYTVQDVLSITVTFKKYPAVPDALSSIPYVPNLNSIISTILKPHPITKLPNISKEDISWICFASSSLLLSQPIILRIKTPIVIVGDIHGKFFDLLAVFKTHGFPGTTNYLFLGDYVDRGRDSVDTILLLLAFKLKYPNSLFLLRGNHESSECTKRYGFNKEAESKGLDLEAFLYAFDSLPLAAIIDSTFFCVHGGISPALYELAEIESFKRPKEIPITGLINDIVWSDPTIKTEHFIMSTRNTGFCFGKAAAHAFLDRIGCQMIIRGHECISNGYMFPFGTDYSVVTVFTSPKYHDDNRAATMTINEEHEYFFESFVGYSTKEEDELAQTDFSVYLDLD